ncbi:hypothetical protein V6Z12_D06G161100 [Gossypium hirsutum]
MAIDFLPSQSYAPLGSPLCPQNDENPLPPLVVGIPTLRPPSPLVNKSSPQPWWHRPQNYLAIYSHFLPRTHLYCLPSTLFHHQDQLQQLGLSKFCLPAPRQKASLGPPTSGSW